VFGQILQRAGRVCGSITVSKSEMEALWAIDRAHEQISDEKRRVQTAMLREPGMPLDVAL
jgi:hypothetical protein